LGNSITHHGALPEIGWPNDWGMAASSKDKDYVHVLMDTLTKSHKNIHWDYHYHSIAYWERDFNFDFSTDNLVKVDLNYKPDILIIRLGENVQDEYAKNNDYESALVKLINKFKSENSKVIITGNFWPNAFKDNIQRAVASKNNYSFVDLSELSNDINNQAGGKFENPGVAMHPSDFGMRNIAIKILDQINEDL
jgi:alpha-galactosidase